jgi:hypothetical protein
LAAAEATEELLSRFRKNEASNAIGFVTGIATVFTAYPEFIARLASDPLRGLPARSPFPPSIAEVKAFCEEVARPHREDRIRREQIAAQLEERKLLPAPSEEAARAETVEEMRARLGDRWGIEGDPEKPRPGPLALPKLAEKYGLTIDKQGNRTAGSVLDGCQLSPEILRKAGIEYGPLVGAVRDRREDMDGADGRDQGEES